VSEVKGSVAEVELRREYPDNPTVAEITRRNVGAIRATVIGLSRVRKAELGTRRATRKAEDPGASGPGASGGQAKQADVDPWTRLEREGKIVPPPFDLLTLAVMPENNTELGPAIDAMAVNVESFGYRMAPRIPVDENTSLEILETLLQEEATAANFFENACAEGESLEDLREKCRRDLEATGNMYVEFVEVPGSGRLDGLNHLPSWTMRISRLDEELTEYVEKQVKKQVRLVEVPEEEPEVPEEPAPALEEAPGLPPLGAERERASGRPALADAPDLGARELSKQRYQEEVSYSIEEVTRFRRFRRYVQIHERTATWFKELGDPRLIDSSSGRPVTREQLLKEEPDAKEEPRFTLDGDALVIRAGRVGFPVHRAANPVRHRRLYSTRSPYGLPRFTGHLFCIFGSRAAEEINYTTFKNNNVPSMAISVSNGKLDDESLERIEEFVEATIQSDDNYSKFLLLEAEPVMEGMRDPGSMKIEITPLTKEQHTDALFVNYKAANDDSVRRAWRFPPIFVGKSEDFTGKTIDASRKLADEQVFQPERNKVDRFFTRDVLVRYLSIIWSTFRSMSPNVTENADLVRLLAQGEKTGGLTPRIARKLIGRVVNENLGEIDSELLEPDQPFSLTLAQLMKTNAPTAAAGGGEPTSQGRAGIQVAGPERDRASEPAAPDLEEDEVERLAEMIRQECRTRFGGFIPPAFLADVPEAGED
jgi:PBSX family phage portal protein